MNLYAPFNRSTVALGLTLIDISIGATGVSRNNLAKLPRLLAFREIHGWAPTSLRCRASRSAVLSRSDASETLSIRGLRVAPVNTPGPW